jgi:hypothetical protein
VSAAVAQRGKAVKIRRPELGSPRHCQTAHDERDAGGKDDLRAH